MLRAEMLAVLFVLGGFVPLIDADFPARILQPADGVLTGRFLDSLLLTLPPCDPYAGQSVDIEYNNANTNETKTLTNIFKVPNCTDTSRTFYQLTNLNSGTEYRIQYKVGADNSTRIPASTLTATDYNQINDGLQARSGAMVVITVILSVAMFFLLICLIVSTVLSTN